jgi:hypothetical protein
LASQVRKLACSGKSQADIVFRNSSKSPTASVPFMAEGWINIAVKWDSTVLFIKGLAAAVR